MIYFDNAATTFPKPDTVLTAMVQSMQSLGANPGRGGFAMSIAVAEEIYKTRETASKLFGAAGAECVVFTHNCTHAINFALKGVLKKGDHVVVSNLEHNAMVRPLTALAKQGITVDFAPVSEGNSEKTVQAFREKIRPDTKMIACMAASNVFGIRLPIMELGQLAKEKNLLFLVDSAQTAGIIPIDVKKCNIDYLCMPGHKGLYGPMGTGILIVNNPDQMGTIIEGGTGGNSDMLVQPEYLPERLESGTVNMPGIIGLGAGMNFVMEQGMDHLYSHEMNLAKKAYEGLSSMKGIRLYTNYPDNGAHVPTISFNIGDLSSSIVAGKLGKEDIASRSGLQCAPVAHQSMGTIDGGTVRISFSAFNTEQEVIKFLEITNKML